MRKIASILIVLGLASAVVGRLPVGKTVKDLVMADGDREVVEEGLTLYLDRFRIDRYPSGKPKQYVSAVKVLEGDARMLSAAEIRVNHPFRKKGWWIYQFGFGLDQTETMCTQLRCVRDPMLGVAAAGGILVMLGALGCCFVKREEDVSVSTGKRRVISWIAAVSVVALPVFIIGRAVMRPDPVPALQSWLMGPHVAAYAMGYLILFFSIFGIGRRFAPFGFLLMTLGLVLGAVWGKLAWSEWWQFDPKENWSFATWFAFALYLQFRSRSKKAVWFLWLAAALAVITLTWVNFSRLMVGLHSYA